MPVATNVNDEQEQPRGSYNLSVTITDNETGQRVNHALHFDSLNELLEDLPLLASRAEIAYEQGLTLNEYEADCV